jgi:hypothetical protein
MLEAAEVRCPQCGQRFNRGTLGIVKASSVRVAAGETDEVYSSLDDLPADLRRQLQRALNGPESETILIADEKGREHVFSVIEGLPPDIRKRVLAVLRIRGSAAPLHSTAVRAALVLVAVVFVMLVVWWVWISASSVSPR